MGQKIHPNGFRVGITRDWNSRWFARKRHFADLLVEDHKVRRFIKKEYYFAQIPKVEIERKGDQIMILVHCARPGVLIGRKGVKVDKLKQQLELMTKKDVTLNIHEVTRPELSAQIVAEQVAEQIERRASFRRALKRSMQLTMERGAKGVKIRIAGRLGGSEIARVQTQLAGSIPLTTLTADIDYGQSEARCSYGRTGVKVWIYTGPIRRGPAISRGR